MGGLKLAGTEGCENKKDAPAKKDDKKKDDKKDDKKEPAKKRILQAPAKKDNKKPAHKGGIFEWNMQTKVNGKLPMSAWNAYIKMPMALPEKDITMTNACMASAPFKRLYNGVMFGKLND